MLSNRYKRFCIGKLEGGEETIPAEPELVSDVPYAEVESLSILNCA